MRPLHKKLSSEIDLNNLNLNNFVGVYPGTFDPITSGHLDIIDRALKVVNVLYISIAEDSSKDTLFSSEERKELIFQELEKTAFNLDDIKITSFKGLTVNYAKHIGAAVIIRGLRAVSDFEYEFQLACMNSKLDDDIQTIFLPASAKWQLVSSKLVKEVVRLGGDVGDFASSCVVKKIKEKFGS